ncbi:glycoside hydrolase family 2 TIM barrel-domain containing protein [Pontiellaceae bacterium B1224]|nr:glycoside hydrolase family 2 TIM barrel-domain containing protein [Pontiellaceae bacterium B1224]
MKCFIYLLTIGMMCSCGSASGPGSVKVSERRILVNDAPYLITGICYHPVPKGSSDRNFQGLEKDLALMEEAGVNTIRVYGPIDDKTVLDKIHAAGMKVIIGFGYNQGEHFDILSGTFIDYVNTYKSHPAILMWELGNEYNYHPQWFEDDIKNWYTALNNAAELIHQNDPSHPVTTAHGELPDELALSLCPDVDVWGMNVYRWDDPEEIFKEWARVSDKPMYLSEAGADSFMTAAMHGYKKGENEKAQARATERILKGIFRHSDICSGVAIFSFTDGWWKAGSPDTQDPGGSAPNSGGVPYDGAANEEYWGIVDIDRNKKKVFDVVKEQYEEQQESRK